MQSFSNRKKIIEDFWYFFSFLLKQYVYIFDETLLRRLSMVLNLLIK
jgi:hypothetical protein